jgi:hypothetical protein
MLAVMDYPKTATHPEFTFALRVNFASGGSPENFGFRFVGSEGTMSTDMSKVVLSKNPRETEPWYSGPFSKATMAEVIAEYRKKYPVQAASSDAIRPQGDTTFRAPQNYNAQLEHHRNFYSSVRSRKPVVEDATFGLRAAGPALLTIKSLDEGKACGWDAEAMKVSA